MVCVSVAGAESMPSASRAAVASRWQSGCGRRAFENEPCRLGQFRIFQSNRHFRQAHRWALDRAVKDAVRHALRAQGLVALLAQHPGDGVHHVGLAAAVRPDDAGRANAG